MLEGSLLSSTRRALQGVLVRAQGASVSLTLMGVGAAAEPLVPRQSATTRRQNVRNDGKQEENDDDTIVDGPRVLSSVALSLTFRKSVSQRMG